jgi:hypothetical protein
MMTIGVLSWGAHRTLINTLKSYQALGIDKVDDERIIFFQEISATDRDIAKKYGWHAYGATINIGIAQAYRELVNLASGDLFLFLENDWVALEGPQQLYEAGELLRNRVIDVARLRHRQYPGDPLYTRQFEGYEERQLTHLLDSIHWTDPAQKWPEKVTWDGGWYFTSSMYANWTNNPTMFRTEWLKDYIVPRLGNKDIEVDIQEWWENQTFNVAQGAGIFTHKRIG